MSKPDAYLNIAVPTPLRRGFHYLPAAGAATGVATDALQPGMRCRVPFGRRQVIGVLMSIDSETAVDPDKLRAIKAVIDTEPVLPPSLIELCRWAASYYHHPIGEVMTAALPVLLRQGEPMAASVERLRVTPAGKTAPTEALARAPRQASLLRQLVESPRGLERAELNDQEYSRTVIKGLLERGFAKFEEEKPASTRPFSAIDVTTKESLPTLTAEQSTAVDAINEGGATPTLLYGITGSGKTEVYLRVIENVLRAGRQALVLVPEIALTPQTIRRFAARFNVDVVALHSGLNDRERLNAWRAAATGAAGIVIGTRSAIFTPLANPGVIVVDEEHDGSFKQQDGFRYHARDLAVMRARLEQIPILLGSATPSLESWHNAMSDRYRLSTLTVRPGNAKPASYQILNLRHENLVEGFAGSLIAGIQSRLERGEQVLIFLNRRGFSPVLLCPDCGWLAECTRCDSRMTLHHTSRSKSGGYSLTCHHCGNGRSVMAECPSCKSKELFPVGEGTQRIEQSLGALFPGFPVIRIDRDSTRPRQAMEKFMAQIETGEPALLVGTQMLAKGHHFPNVTLVVIKDMDAAFYSANFKSPERTGQLILQVGGRAGREEKPGVVAIETHLPDQPMFRQLIDVGYAAFADSLLEERRLHEMPPYHHQALIRAEAKGKALAIEFLDDVLAKLPQIPSVLVLGPVPASMEKRAGKYRAQLLITSNARAPLHQMLNEAIRIADGAPQARRVRWSVDVDPVDLF